MLSAKSNATTLVEFYSKAERVSATQYYNFENQ